MAQRDLAMEEVRRVVLSGQVPIGERTSERVLTEKFLGHTGLGRTPVREALAILTAQGVIEQHPQVGFVVRHVDAAEARKVLELQRATEGLIVSDAAQTRIDVSRLDELADQITTAALNGSSYVCMDTARTFHMMLSRLAGYETAAGAIGGFRDRYALFLAATTPLDRREMAAMASRYRDLSVSIAADESGSKAEERLSELISTEFEFVSARKDGEAMAVSHGDPALAVSPLL
ncbi:MAG TPA: GntR family transcriptional regulator [Actinomycetota bacterium]|nr:GntR family transcriptional regulator [Actinomycetota bacterium]